MRNGASSKRVQCAAAGVALALTCSAQGALIGPFNTVDLADGFVQTGPFKSALSNTNNRPDEFYGTSPDYPGNPQNTYGSYNLTTNNITVNGVKQRAVFDRAGGPNYNVFSFNNPTPDSAFDSRPGNAFSYNNEYASYDNGFAQSGGGDNTVQYGVRDRYLVQLDAILPSDRLDISSGLVTTAPPAGQPGGALGTPGALNVFFRKVSRSQQAFGNNRNIDLYRAGRNVQLPFGNGVDDDNWHNFAVEFDRANNLLSIYTDNVLNGVVDLNTFDNGFFKDFSTSTVGFGGNGVYYADNFTVSGIGPIPVPEPTSLVGLGVAGAALLTQRRRRSS